MNLKSLLQHLIIFLVVGIAATMKNALIEDLSQATCEDEDFVEEEIVRLHNSSNTTVFSTSPLVWQHNTSQRRQSPNPQAAPFVPGQVYPYAVPGAVNIVAPDPIIRSGIIFEVSAVYRLAASALLNIREPGQESISYRRYFQPEDRCRVKAVFKRILGPNGLGPNNMNCNFPCFVNPFQYALNIENAPPMAADPAQLRYFTSLCYVQLPRWWDKTASRLCERLYPQHPKLSRLLLRPMSSVMLHEVNHWERVVGHLSGGNIGDFGIPPLPPGTNPPDGYGPYNAMIMNRNGYPSIRNADSYANFALESWLLRNCADEGWTHLEDPDISDSQIPF